MVTVDKCCVELVPRLYPSIKRVQEGKDAQFTCLSLVEPNWDWVGELRPNNTYIHQLNSTAYSLTITATRQSNSGRFQCIGKDLNTHEMFATYAKLIVTSIIEGKEKNDAVNQCGIKIAF